MKLVPNNTHDPIIGLAWRVTPVIVDNWPQCLSPDVPEDAICEFQEATCVNDPDQPPRYSMLVQIPMGREAIQIQHPMPPARWIQDPSIRSVHDFMDHVKENLLKAILHGTDKVRGIVIARSVPENGSRGPRRKGGPKR